MTFLKNITPIHLIFTGTIICLISFNTGAYLHNLYPEIFWFKNNNKIQTYDDLIEDLESSLNELKEEEEPKEEEKKHMQQFDFTAIAERMVQNSYRQS